MKFPKIAYGQEHRGSIRLQPDIPEQLELAKRMDTFLRAAGDAAITPTIRSRSFKDFRTAQPNGTAHLSASYSNELDGRLSAEIHASHKPSGIQSHYSLFADGGHWLHIDSSRRRQPDPSFVNHDDMVMDMLEYSPKDGQMAELLDRVATANAIVKAIHGDMTPSAHFKSGSDHYRTVLSAVEGDGSYASARHIELIDARVNRKVSRRLSITALTNIGAGPVDVKQSLVYQVHYDRHGRILEDDIRLTNTSSDGLSPAALTKLAETSDITQRPTDLLHDALGELSWSTFIEGKVA